MQANHTSSGPRLLRTSPGLAIALGVLYALGLGMVDSLMPPRMSFTLYYVFGVAYAGWCAGRTGAGLIALFSALIIGWVEWFSTRGSPQPAVLAWNTLTRLAILGGIGWLVAETARLARNLARLVEAKTAQYKTEALQHKEACERLAFALDAARMVTWEYDPATDRITYSNNAASVARGENLEPYSSSAALLGQVHPEDRDRLARALQQITQRNEPFEQEYRVRMQDGRYYWILAKGRRICDATGRMIRLVGVSIDHTDWKRAELAVQLQRDLAVELSATSELKRALEVLLEQAVRLEGVDCGGVYLVDPKDGSLCLAASRGLSPEFIAAVSHYPADSQRSRLVRAGKPVYGLQNEVLEGENRPLEKEGIGGFTAIPLIHQQTLLGCLNLANHTQQPLPADLRVVVETLAAQAGGAIVRLRVAEELKENEARLRTIINSAPIVLFAVDQNEVITFGEGQALQPLGFGTGANLGKRVGDVFGETPAVVSSIRRALKGETFGEILRIREFWLEVSYVPRRDARGRVTGCVGVATNVTERQRLQREILEISDREQARIGQEIHDGLCQELIGLAFDANSLQSALSARHHPLAPQAARITSGLDQTITKARGIARGLFPANLETEGLALALEGMAHLTSARFGIPCTFAASGTVEVPFSELAINLYRIAQEAVTNAAKHSRARSIAIRLLGTADRLEITVEDDGQGLPLGPARPAQGMGLQIMQYRAQLIGARLQLGPRQNGGTVVSCCLPRHPALETLECEPKAHAVSSPGPHPNPAGG
jgi:PAS domain S-box-containing protein